jgi:hypothetical protein
LHTNLPIQKIQRASDDFPYIKQVYLKFGRLGRKQIYVGSNADEKSCSCLDPTKKNTKKNADGLPPRRSENTDFCLIGSEFVWPSAFCSGLCGCLPRSYKATCNHQCPTIFSDNFHFDSFY